MATAVTAWVDNLIIKHLHTGSSVGLLSINYAISNLWHGTQEVVMELEEETSMMKVSGVIHQLFHWGRQSISVDSLVAKKDPVTEIV